MPHALIPDGFTLKKVTKSEERAVNNKRRHDNIQSLIENPATIPVLATSAGVILGGVLLDKFIELLQEAGGNISDSGLLEKIKQQAIDSAGFIAPDRLISGAAALPSKSVDALVKSLLRLSQVGRV